MTRRSPMPEGSRGPHPASRRRLWPAVWALLLLDVVAVPSVYRLWRDIRGDVADAALDACAGDCDQDAAVVEGELLTGVAIALGDVPLAVCPAFDVVDAGEVTVDELVRAVIASLGPCRFVPPTVTPTDFIGTPFTPNAQRRATPPPP